MIKLKRVKASLIIAGIVVFFTVYAKDHKSRGPVNGYLEDGRMDETSGMAASIKYSGTYYVHNDSGDTSRFFAITPDGKAKAEITYKGVWPNNFSVRDCEDIAVGPGPEKGKSYVYIGDIGDNDASRPILTIYRTEEPDLNKHQASIHAEVSALHVKYPDGPKDAETMMVDPVEQLIYIVSKRKGSVSVYTTPLNFNTNDTVTLTKQKQLHFSGLQPLKWIVGGSISHSGDQVLLKSYVNVYYWKRKANEPLWQTMQQKPQKLSYKREKQGEAIAFTPDGKSYFTVSEGLNAPIYHYTIP